MSETLKEVINTYEPKGLAGTVVNITQDFLGKFGFSIVSIASAPFRGAYVAGVKPALDVIISILTKKS